MSIEYAEDVVKKALSKGCDEAEVFIRSSKGISVEAKGGEVEALEASLDLGIAIRTIKNRKQGFSFATTFENIDATIDRAIDGGRWTGEDSFIGIAEHSPAAEVQIYDVNIRDIKEERVIHDALNLEKSALDFDQRVRKVRKAEVAAGTSITTLYNSNSVNACFDSSYYSAHVTTLAEDDKGDSQMGWEYSSSRRLNDIDLKAVGEESSRRAIELLGSRKISAVKVPVILSPSVAIDFLEILSASLSADAVQKGRSFLAGKTGKKIVSERLNIIDDGTMAWGSGSSPVDDEGVPSMRNVLVSEGVLQGFIHNTYTARKEGVYSTGNAVRGSTMSLPGVGVRNLFIEKTSKAEDSNIVQSLSKGIVILSAMGVHTANPVSGDFSVGISGLWVENGQILYPVKEAVISGNILDMFKKIEATGNDIKFYGNVGSPSLLIGEMDVSA
jgi:PmbA protein